MEHSRAVPPSLSAEGAKRFLAGDESCRATTGEEPETRTTKDPIGIDLPGVGVVRPEVSSVCAGREGVAREDLQDLPGGADLPEPLRSFLDGERNDLGTESRRERSERLFSQLLFAARDLALGQMAPAVGDDPAFCMECLTDEHDGAIAHTAGCCAARVLKVIAELIATVQPNSKETVADGEKPGAGDGIRPQGLTGMVCLLCGEQGGHWTAEPAAAGPGRTLASNQVAQPIKGEAGFRIYTHHCLMTAEGGAQ